MIAATLVGALIAARIQARINEVEAVLLRVAHGDLTARLTVSRQGSDLDQISAAINHALARLGALVEAMRQVSADIAHDLRSPLNRLRNRLELAAMRLHRDIHRRPRRSACRGDRRRRQAADEAGGGKAQQAAPPDPHSAAPDPGHLGGHDGDELHVRFQR